MRKHKSLIPLVIAAVMITLLFSGCGGLVNTMESGTISFESNGGSTISPKEAVGYIEEPDAPIKYGYTFTGWFCDEACTNSWNFSLDLIEGDMTLYAGWVTNRVTYESNGADSGDTPSPQTKVYGQNLTLATNSGNLSKNGYLFIGWNTAADGSGTDYLEGTSYSTDSSLILFAKWIEIKELLASDGAADDRFGYAISIDGDTAVIGSYGDSGNSGSAYIFTRSGTTWSQQAKLVPDDGVAGDQFGWAVSLSGDTAVIGAQQDDDRGEDSGSAYIFTRSENSWTQQAKLIASDGGIYEYFGATVCIEEDTIVIGSYGDNNYAGSAYIFTRSGTTWSQQQKLTVSDGANSDFFGKSLSISGDTLVIGAYYNDEGGSNSGSAYVFTRTGTTWSQQQKLMASDGVRDEKFGYAVSIDGDTIAIGAPNDRANGLDSGSAYVFTRLDSIWTQQDKLTAGDGETEDKFGYAISIDDNTVVIGAPFEDEKGSNSGSAYIFTRSGTTWSQQVKLTTPDGVANDCFGHQVYIDGDIVLTGVYGKDDNGTDSGAVYSFDVSSVVE